MKYRLVAKLENGWQTLDYDNVDDFAAMLGASGHPRTGYNDNPRQRAELQGQPKFAGLCGPMYDGPGVIRYENPAAYAALSA